MRNKHINLVAYNDFENLKNFHYGLEKYHRSKLFSARRYVDFIKVFFPNKEISVLELGSGNSRTLFALENAGILKKGYGIEISKSRFEFAEDWKKAGGYTKVENINADVSHINYDNFKALDLCICLDFVFHTFEPIKKSNPIKILTNIYKSLQLGGKIILELDGYERIITRMDNGGLKFWQEFPPSDPWRYVLCDCRYDLRSKFLKWEKKYIKRSEFGFSKSTVILRVYNKDEIVNLLRNAGFKKIKLYSDWDGKFFKNANSEYIAVGIK